MKYFIISLFIYLILLGCAEKKESTSSQNSIPSCAPVVSDKEWYKSDNIAPLFDGLDVLDFPITTENELVQRYFNQGLVLAYGFNHAEAARSFYYATKLDSTCAMALWGYSYVLGPNYNAGMESDNYERAHEAVTKAMELSQNSTPKEQALIKALSQRYVKDVVEDRSALDMAYSIAMKNVYNKYPDDEDVATLYSESLMNLHPWDLWDKDGTIREWTSEILDLLSQVLASNPKHIGANHFYIHAIEASKNPEKGLTSAKVFDDGVVPGAGHLVHMPSHIYIRTGDYHLGTLSNINAVKADSNYITACRAQGVYPLAYFPHNFHFMAATATLEGNSKWAILAANKVSGHVNKQLMKEPGWGTLQHYYTIPYNVYVKFGKWDDILNMKKEESSLKYPTAVQHYARGMAFIGKNDLISAKKELVALEEHAKDESLKEITVWEINSVYTLIQIARRVLKAEILASEASYKESIKLLAEAAQIEDNLNYNEPPDWFFSVRHHLGAVQIEAAKYKDALITFEDDLERLPKNGWALHGLKLAHTKLNDIEKVSQVDEQLKHSWATADIQLSNARLK